MAHPNHKAHSPLTSQTSLEVSRAVSHAHGQPIQILQAWSPHRGLLFSKLTSGEPCSIPSTARGVQPAPSVPTQPKSYCVSTVKERPPHSPTLEDLYQLVPHSFEKTAIYFLPIAPLSPIRVLSQDWAVEQATPDPFCFTFPHPQTPSIDSGVVGIVTCSSDAPRL